MGLISIGRIVRPHGVKGGMKVSSDFKYKNKAFNKDNTIYINDKPYKIFSYTNTGGNQLDIMYLDGINTIDDVITIRHNDIYINKNDLDINEILDEELLGMEVYYNDELIGTVDDIKTGINPLIIVNNTYIPRQDEFISNIDINNGKIILTDKYKELL